LRVLKGSNTTQGEQINAFCSLQRASEGGDFANAVRPLEPWPFDEACVDYVEGAASAGILKRYDPRANHLLTCCCTIWEKAWLMAFLNFLRVVGNGEPCYFGELDLTEWVF
jgi:hypothetical protein